MKKEFNVDFHKFMELISSNRSVNHMSNEEINEVYSLASYYGLFSGQSTRSDDQANCIDALINTFQKMKEISKEKDISNTFHVKINAGPEQTITTRTGKYHLAVLAALAMLEYEEKEENIIEIWVPELLPQYGPYKYLFNGHQIYNC